MTGKKKQQDLALLDDDFDVDALEPFRAELTEIPIKGHQESMELPLFSLSTKPDTSVYRYENHATGDWIEVTGGPLGRATMHDKDLLLFCISQINQARREGRQHGRKIRFTRNAFFAFAKRNAGGGAYKRFDEMTSRLKTTTVTIRLESGRKQKRLFGFLDSATLLDDGQGGEDVEIILSSHFYDMITNTKQLLTYTDEYFEIRSPNERRLYEIIRKHCGKQPMWECSFEKLYAKSGTRANKREFRRFLKKVVEEQPIPGYYLILGARDKLEVLSDPDGVCKSEHEAGRIAQAKSQAAADSLEAYQEQLSTVER